MQKILSTIAEADSAQLSEIIQAIFCRYRQLHPEWEFFFLSLPRNTPEKQQRILDAVRNYIK